MVHFSSLHPVCFVPGVGQAQGHGQHGGAAAGVPRGGRGVRRAAGGDDSAVPLPAAALQGHQGSGNAAAAAN